MNLSNLGVQEMNAKETKETKGGWTLFRWTGFLDGIRGNTEITLLGWRIY